MRVHVIGIGGTFMGGIAQLAQQAGHEVTGSDAQVYPPMSTQLEQAGIEVIEGYDAEQLNQAAEQWVVGNVMTRGKPIVEALLNRGLPYTSGPQWLAEQVLRDRWVLAVSGTHGKTTTSSMLAWILEDAGLSPGFLIGGVPENFGVSARLGESPFFVVEADEYDTAFFDKRSKFIHYRPRTLIVNNLEYDHADIFEDLPAIQRQFHHLIRTVPGEGLIVCPADQTDAVNDTLDMGCWTPVERFGEQAEWRAVLLSDDGSAFQVLLNDEVQGEVRWPLIGQHNVNNALAAMAAARHAGVPVSAGVSALSRFRGIKRRMQLRGEVNGVRVYDDFAHHPTAIQTTLAGAKASHPEGRLIAVLEPRSNTMRMGTHQHALAASLAQADAVWVYQPDDLGWSLTESLSELNDAHVHVELDALLDELLRAVRPGDWVVIMSNGGFGGLHERLVDGLKTVSMS